jgi:predicted kinase
MSKTPTLYIFSGLPGVGKTTLAKALANYCKATLLRIDTVEQGIRDLCSFKVRGEGYRLSYKLAIDNLKIGNSVIADSCNPVQLTRKEWQEAAISVRAEFINIEVICSDREIHKQRVEARCSDIPNLSLPSWQDILQREYHQWNEAHIIIDTAIRPIEDCHKELIQAIKEQKNVP